MPRPRRFRGFAGAAYVEFLVVAPPLLLLLFGLAQIGLVYGAELLVQHAAARAVRAAIVVLPDDAEGADYAGDPINRIGVAGEGLAAYGAAVEGGRLDQIRKAARLTLAPVSPPLGALGAGSLAQALDGGAGSLLAGLLGFTEWTVGVTFPDGAGGYATSFAPRQPITARVTFLYQCTVPLARALVCRSVSDLDPEATARLPGGAAAAAGLAGARFAVLEAERTLPNQGR